MSKFRHFNDGVRGRQLTPSGCRLRDKSELVVEPDGRRYLRKVGTVDQYDVIQSFKDECSLETIIRRYDGGDVNALNRAQGAYIDATALPNNIHEAHDVIRYAERMYSKLPQDIRAKFGGFSGFINEMSDTQAMIDFFNQALPGNKVKEKKEAAVDES